MSSICIPKSFENLWGHGLVKNSRENIGARQYLLCACWPPKRPATPISIRILISKIIPSLCFFYNNHALESSSAPSPAKLDAGLVNLQVQSQIQNCDSLRATCCCRHNRLLHRYFPKDRRPRTIARRDREGGWANAHWRNGHTGLGFMENGSNGGTKAPSWVSTGFPGHGRGKCFLLTDHCSPFLCAFIMPVWSSQVEVQVATRRFDWDEQLPLLFRRFCVWGSMPHLCFILYACVKDWN